MNWRRRSTTAQFIEEHDMDGEFEVADLFRSIRYNRGTKLENQKLALNVLDATESTLRDKELLLEPENYFLAMWPLVDNEEKEQQGKMNKMAATNFNVAVMYLLSFVISRLSAGFIHEHYSEIYSKVGSALDRFITFAPFVRASLILLGKVMSSFSTNEWYERSSLNELLSLVLQLAVDPRPKVRKSAQEVLQQIFRQDIAPARSAIVEFVAKMVLHRATRKNHVDALHIIAFLRCISSNLNNSEMDQLIKPLLKCSSLGNTHLTVAIFELITILCDLAYEGQHLIDPNCSGLLLKTLHASQKPELVLVDIIPSWMNLFTKSLRLHKLISVNTIDELKSCFASLFAFLASSESSVLQAVEDALRNLYCLIDNDCLAAEICSLLCNWLQVRDSPAALFVIRSVGDYCREVAVKSFPRELLFTLGDFYCSKPTKGLSNAIEKSIGAFVMQFGPEAVLEVIPLNLGGQDIPRAWLLSILKDSVSHARIAYWKEHLLPCADYMESRASQFMKEKKVNDAKVCQVITHQVWSTLPAFMTFPLDFGASFPSLAPILGQHLTTSPYLRPIIVKAFISFVHRARSFDVDDENYPNAASDLSVISGMATQFLPILFNIYGITAAERREHLLNCIEAFISITDTNVIKERYFERVLDRLDKVKELELISFLEISSILVKNLDLESHGRLLRKVLDFIKSNDLTVQKRTYRVIGDILNREDFDISKYLETLESILLSGYDAKLNSSIKKVRFRVLLKLSTKLPDDSLHWVPLFLPEIVLGTKEVNQQARMYAFELLLSFARRMSCGGTIMAARTNGILAEDSFASLNEFLTMIIAGLAGATPHMISATIMALARIIFEFRDSIDSGLLSTLLSDVIATLASPSREVVKSALGFIKVALSSLDQKQFKDHLGTLINGVLQWSNEHHQNFKVRTRHLIERLIRRFGFEEIWELTPLHHRKLLTNIKKRKERLRRQKAGNPTSVTESECYEDLEDQSDKLTSAALSGATVLTKMTSFGGRSLKAANRFEQTLHDSGSELESDVDSRDGAEFELAADSILNDIGNVDDDAEIEKILKRKLSLAGNLGKSKKILTRDKYQIDHDKSDENDNIQMRDGRWLIQSSGSDHDEEDEEEDENRETNSNKRRTMGKKHVQFAEQPEAKKTKESAKKPNGKFEPYSYLPITRASKKNKKNQAIFGKKSSKYFMKRA